MNDVFIVYGHDDFYECVLLPNGDYFHTWPVLEVFETYEDALKRFKQLVIKAYRNLKENNFVVDGSFAEKTTEDDLFRDYNVYQGSDDMSWEEYSAAYDEFMDTLPELDVQWTYQEEPGKSAQWQMMPLNIPAFEPVPILPGLYIKKLR